jgi:hypothetical protein
MSSDDKAPQSFTLVCTKHDVEETWQGQVACSECGRVYWLPFGGVPEDAEIVEPENPPFCDCLEVLLATDADGKFVLPPREGCHSHGTADPICSQCYAENKPRIEGYKDAAPSEGEQH